MMGIIKELHKQLIRKGYFKAARLILKLMYSGSVFVSDNNQEAYESGVVDFLMKNCSYSNHKYGFTAYKN